MTLASILKGKVLCHFFTCYVGLKFYLRKNALRRLTIIGLEVKCTLLPKAHVLKTWSPVQECSEMGCWGGDWSRKILTFWMAWSIHGSITQEHVGPGGGRTFTWGPVRSRWCGCTVERHWDLSYYLSLSLLPGCHRLGGVPLPQPPAPIYCTIWPQA